MFRALSKYTAIAVALMVGTLATELRADTESTMTEQSTTLSPRSLRKIARATSKPRGASNFSNVCATVRNVTGSEFLYKSEISRHITGDARVSGPTLICNRICPASFPAALYDSSGKLLARLGVYGTWRVTGKRRAYCAAGGAPACSNSTIARETRARGKDGFAYLQVSSAKTGKSTVCYRVRPTGRTGSPT